MIEKFKTMIDRLLLDEEEFYEDIWGKLFLFFFPFFIGFSYIFLLFLIFRDINNVFWVIGPALFAYFFPPFGKESVIPVTIVALKGTLDPFAYVFLVSGSIAFIDIINSYFLMWNFYIVKKIPVLGNWIDDFQDYGAKKIEQNQWIKRVSFLGVASFVVFPFQGSGGVGASILGRVIGLKKFHAWLAIIIGSLIGSFTLGILSHYMGEAVAEAFERNIWAGLGAIVVIIVVFIFFYYIAKTRLFKDPD